MKAIGGYFELELRKGKHYHEQALRLNTGRNCLEYILCCRGYEHIYIPYYGCEVILEPINKLGIRYTFYHINELLEPIDLPELGDKDAFFYTNYYALKNNFIKSLALRYGNQLVVDNAQAFFERPLDGIDTFYTARKFFGVSDGAYLYLRGKNNADELPQDESWSRMSHLLMRHDGDAQFGFEAFHTNNGSLHNQPIKRMSRMTEAIMQSIDYAEVMQKRKTNFEFLHQQLGEQNGLKHVINGPALGLDYPFYIEENSLRQRLIDNQIFIAKLWPNIAEWCEEGSLEWKLMTYTFHLPIDQRYGIDDMQRIVDVIKTKR